MFSGFLFSLYMSILYNNLTFVITFHLQQFYSLVLYFWVCTERRHLVKVSSIAVAISLSL